MKFSKKIDLLMKKRNIKNLRQLASDVDIPYTTLWDYYSNPIRLERANLTYIKKIAKYLECTVDYLAYDEITDPNSEQIDNLEEIKKEDLEDLSALENVLYMKKGKIDSAKNLPEEKQQVIANAVKSVLDMIDDENSNNDV